MRMIIIGLVCTELSFALQNKWAHSSYSLLIRNEQTLESCSHWDHLLPLLLVVAKQNSIKISFKWPCHAEDCRLLMWVYDSLMFSPRKLNELSAHHLIVSFKDKRVVRITQKSLRNKDYNGNETRIPGLVLWWCHWLLTLSAILQAIWDVGRLKYVIAKVMSTYIRSGENFLFFETRSYNVA